MEEQSEIEKLNKQAQEMLKIISEKYPGQPESKIIIQYLDKVSRELTSMKLRAITGDLNENNEPLKGI